jgi:DNA-binding Lrp family transcriptional regulator
MIKLDKIDRKIIFELDQNARMTDTALSKKVGRSREAVRYRIKQLQQRGILTGFSTIVDLGKIGYQGYIIYLNLSGKSEQRDRFYDFLKSFDNLYWLGISEGSWDVGMIFFARSNIEFHKIKQRIISKFSKNIIKKEIGLIIDTLVFPKGYILPNTEKPVQLFFDVKNEKIDSTDIKILNILLNNARINVVDLAKRTKLTIDIVRGRMQKLKQKGIIVKYTVDIDYNVLDLQLFKVFLYFKELPEFQEKKLIQYCNKSRQVLTYVRQITPWDAEIHVMTKTFKEFNQLIREVKDEFADYLLDTESANVVEEHIYPAGKLLLP